MHSSFREDIAKLVFSTNNDYEWDDAVAILELHEDELLQIIHAIEIETNRPMSDGERDAMLEYALVEELKYQSGLYYDTMTIHSQEGIEIETNDKN